jgi:hypothetical protein
VVVGALYVLLAFLKATWLDKLFSKLPYFRSIHIDGCELHHQGSQTRARYDFIVGNGQPDVMALTKTETDKLVK